MKSEILAILAMGDDEVEEALLRAMHTDVICHAAAMDDRENWPRRAVLAHIAWSKTLEARIADLTARTRLGQVVEALVDDRIYQGRIIEDPAAGPVKIRLVDGTEVSGVPFRLPFTGTTKGGGDEC